MMIGDPCWPLPVWRWNEQGGQVDDAADLAVGRDAVHFLVIGFGDIKHTMGCHHAIPVTIRLEVADGGVRDGMCLDKMAEVGNKGPCMIFAVYPEDSVGY